MENNSLENDDDFVIYKYCDIDNIIENYEGNCCDNKVVSNDSIIDDDNNNIIEINESLESKDGKEISDSKLNDRKMGFFIFSTALILGSAIVSSFID